MKTTVEMRIAFRAEVEIIESSIGITPIFNPNPVSVVITGFEDIPEAQRTEVRAMMESMIWDTEWPCGY